MPASIQLIKFLKRTSPRIDPWRAQLVTSLETDLAPNTTNFQTVLLSQFITQHTCLSHSWKICPE